MKTKQQIKDEYAASLGYANWSIAIKCLALFDPTDDSIKAIDKFIDGYQELCCNEVATATLEKTSEKIKCNRICEKCNSEYQLPLGNSRSHLTYNFGDCPNCNMRDDVWISIEKESITSPDNIVLL